MDQPASDQAVALNMLELELREPDCVMEPGVLDTITRYIKAAGKPTDAIENLTSYYVGARWQPLLRQHLLFALWRLGNPAQLDAVDTMSILGM